MMLMLMVLAGAGLIADDLKSQRPPALFRPAAPQARLPPGQDGRSIAFFVLLLTLVPGLLFILLKLIFSGSFSFLAQYPWLPLAVVGSTRSS